MSQSYAKSPQQSRIATREAAPTGMPKMAKAPKAALNPTATQIGTGESEELDGMWDWYTTLRAQPEYGEAADCSDEGRTEDQITLLEYQSKAGDLLEDLDNAKRPLDEAARAEFREYRAACNMMVEQIRRRAAIKAIKASPENPISREDVPPLQTGAEEVAEHPAATKGLSNRNHIKKLLRELEELSTATENINTILKNGQIAKYAIATGALLSVYQEIFNLSLGTKEIAKGTSEQMIRKVGGGGSKTRKSMVQLAERIENSANGLGDVNTIIIAEVEKTVSYVRLDHPKIKSFGDLVDRITEITEELDSLQAELDL